MDGCEILHHTWTMKGLSRYKAILFTVLNYATGSELPTGARFRNHNQTHFVVNNGQQ